MFERIMDKVDAKGGGRFSERDAALLMRKILDAVDYCHRIHHICHRWVRREGGRRCTNVTTTTAGRRGRGRRRRSVSTNVTIES